MTKKKLLLIIVFFSAVSTWLDFISVLTYIGYELKLTPIEIAIITIAILIPQSILSPFIIKILKKYNTKKILVTSSIVRTACTFSLLWVSSMEDLVAILFIRSCAVAFFQPIVAKYAKSTGENIGSEFVSSLNLINTVSKIAAPAIGGIISVYLGEKSVFLISALLGVVYTILVIYQPDVSNTKNSRNQTSEKPESTAMNIKKSIIFMAVSIFVINGVFIMFTNLLPYAFNFYDIPKISLSSAISSSAIGAIIFNLYILKSKPVITTFPVNAIFRAWIGIALLLTIIVASLKFANIYVFIISVSYFFISMLRTYYEIYLTSYIYSLSVEVSMKFIVIRQSFSSYAGILITIVGALSMSKFSPINFMLSVTISSLLIAFIWIITYRMFYKSSGNSDANNVHSG